jgi:hypothetical protein
VRPITRSGAAGRAARSGSKAGGARRPDQAHGGEGGDVEADLGAVRLRAALCQRILPQLDAQGERRRGAERVPFGDQQLP